MSPSDSVGADLALVFIELGAATLGLALASRLASRAGVSAIPFYLLGGLAFGNGGLLPLPFSEHFIHVGAEIGVVLLLFSLGLEYTGHELTETLKRSWAAGTLDFVLNFVPALLFGYFMGWSFAVALALGGVTYVSSSGIIAKVLSELGRRTAPETKIIVSILVFEDLAMALFLPIVSIALREGGVRFGWAPVAGIGVLVVLLLLAVTFGGSISRFLRHTADETILLTTFGAVLLLAGIAQRLQVSAAIGAFLVGIAFSGSFAEHAGRVIAPVRDLFAAVFFFFFGLQVAPAQLVPVLPVALALAAVTIATKFGTGWLAAKWAGFDTPERMRAGATLIARGEFSIVIAGIAVAAPGVPIVVASIAAAYVLLTAVIGPIAARFVR